MKRTIKQAAHIAKSNNSSYWLHQVNRDLPYGDSQAMMNAARDEGMLVTQFDGKRFLVDYIAWVNIHGCVSPAT